MDIYKLLTEGSHFKKGKDESQKSDGHARHNKPKGKTISGASKMRAAYKTKKAIKNKIANAKRADKTASKEAEAQTIIE